MLLSEVKVLKFELVVFVSFLSAREFDFFNVFYMLSDRKDIQLIVDGDAGPTVGQAQDEPLVESWLHNRVGLCSIP